MTIHCMYLKFIIDDIGEFLQVCLDTGDPKENTYLIPV